MVLIRRILFLIPLLFAISFFAFVLVRLAPGGPFDKERKPASPEIERALKARYHLDEPVWKQFGRFLAGVARGDLGPSLKYRNQVVSDIIKQGLPISLALGLAAFILANGVGIPLGIGTAVWRGQWQDHIGSLLALLAVCIPGFVLGPVLIMVFAIHWRWLPVALLESPMHMILPTVALGLFFAGKIARLMREGMITALQAEHIVTARAKGLSELGVVMKHAFPLAVLPVVSYAGPLMADLLTGSFVVENLFQIPGIGVFMVNSSLNRDYTLVVGLVVLYAALLLVMNLGVDLLYSLIDPRIRFH